MKIFKDRVAVVTGAASGIGRGITEVFIEAGMKVVMADVDKAKLEASVKTFQNSKIENCLKIENSEINKLLLCFYH